MAKHKSNSNLLPDQERKEAKEIMKKEARPQEAEIRLIIPKMEEKTEKKKKKESFFERRRRLKEEKRLAKMRKKGDIGSAKEILEHEKKEESAHKSKADLFADVSEKKEKAIAYPPKKVEEKHRPAPKPVREHIAAKSFQQHPKPVHPPKRHLEASKKFEHAPKPKHEPRHEKVQHEPKPKDHVKPHKKKKLRNGGKKLHLPEGGVTSFTGPGVNLVPEGAAEIVGGSSWILGTVILIFTVAFWVIVGGIGVSKVKKAEARSLQLNDQISQIQKVINEFDSSKSASQTLQKQLSAIEELVNEHIYWTVVLEHLEKNTIPDVYYRAITAERASNKIIVEGIAKDYAAAARQIRAFEKTPGFIKNIEVGEARIENQPDAVLPVPVVSFGLELTLVDGVLSVENPEDLNQ